MSSVTTQVVDDRFILYKEFSFATIHLWVRCAGKLGFCVSLGLVLSLTVSSHFHLALVDQGHLG